MSARRTEAMWVARVRCSGTTSLATSMIRGVCSRCRPDTNVRCMSVCAFMARPGCAVSTTAAIRGSITSVRAKEASNATTARATSPLSRPRVPLRGRYAFMGIAPRTAYARMGYGIAQRLRAALRPFRVTSKLATNLVSAMGRRSVVVLAAFAILACGARTQLDLLGEPSEASVPQPDSGPVSDGGSGTDANFDAQQVPDAPAVTVTCNTIGTGGVSGYPCQTDINESCSNGESYRVLCSCPEATCACGQMANGAEWWAMSDAAVPYSGCPANSCPAATPTLFAACGFPSGR